MSTWNKVQELPPDAIFLTKTLYNQDTDSRKVDLGIGAYRDDNGKPYVLNVVKKVEKEIINDTKLNKEYLNIHGDDQFIKLSQQLILGKNSKAVAEKRVAGAQSISGTGALRILFEFIKLNFPDAVIYLSSPTWGNHNKIIMKAGLKQATYRYWDPKTCGLDFKGMVEDLKAAPKGSIILFHSCAHNPTGVDPTLDQWEKLAQVCKEKGLIPFFDSAYQGYATGDLDNDAAPVRLFESKGFYLLIAQSFSKNLGLYGERVGCASIICSSEKEAKAVHSHLCDVIRPMYSNPPRHGMEIAKRIMGNEQNFEEWVKELRTMSNRIISVRKKLRQYLENYNTPGQWSHITSQIGMFTYSGLNAAQVERIIKLHHVYMLKDGRISMAGLSSSNVEYVAKAIDEVVRNTKTPSKL